MSDRLQRIKNRRIAKEESRQHFEIFERRFVVFRRSCDGSREQFSWPQFVSIIRRVVRGKIGEITSRTESRSGKCRNPRSERRGGARESKSSTESLGRSPERKPIISPERRRSRGTLNSALEQVWNLYAASDRECHGFPVRSRTARWPGIKVVAGSKLIGILHWVTGSVPTRSQSNALTNENAIDEKRTVRCLETENVPLPTNDEILISPVNSVYFFWLSLVASIGLERGSIGLRLLHRGREYRRVLDYFRFSMNVVRGWFLEFPSHDCSVYCNHWIVRVIITLCFNDSDVNTWFISCFTIQTWGEIW